MTIELNSNEARMHVSYGLLSLFTAVEDVANGLGLTADDQDVSPEDVAVMIQEVSDSFEHQLSKDAGHAFARLIIDLSAAERRDLARIEAGN
jgi:hypothetical protein